MTLVEWVKAAIGNEKQTHFSKKSGISQAELCTLLSGKRDNPSLKVLLKLKKASEGRVNLKFSVNGEKPKAK